MPEALLVCALIGLVSSSAYLALVVVAAARFRARAGRVSAATTDGVDWPPVSVLKPMHGMEPKLPECLESFFTQQYPNFEIVFGARSADDAAWQVVNRLRAQYPGVKICTVNAGPPRYPNAKVSALETMVEAAAFPYLVIADSDTRVAPDYLTQVMRPLLDPQVGLVTCLYRGVSVGGLWSSLEALGMSVEMTAGVLVADMLEGMRFALGPTMATRKDVLLATGGVRALGEYCADDYVLGRRTHEAGKTVVLSHHVIAHLALNRSLRASLQHHVRWMRSTRFSRPSGHLGTGLTFAMPFGIIGLMAGLAMNRLPLGIGLLGWAVLNRLVLCLVAGWGVVRDRDARGRCWLYPARDLLGFVTWCGSFLGSEIIWRDERYGLGSGGQMRPIAAPPVRILRHGPKSRARSETIQ